MILVAELFGHLNPPRNDKTFWVYPFYKNCENIGPFNNFYTDIRNYSQKCFDYYRMQILLFDNYLAEKLHSYTIKKVDIKILKISTPRCLLVNLL